MEPVENPEPAPAATPAAPRPPVRALALIGVCAVCGTAAEVFMKFGALETAQVVDGSWLRELGLTSKWIWVSIGFTLCSFAVWSRTLREVPLSVAFPLANVVHILIPLSSWWFLGESIGPRRWLGIALVIVGLAVIARPYTQMDERL